MNLTKFITKHCLPHARNDNEIKISVGDLDSSSKNNTKNDEKRSPKKSMLKQSDTLSPFDMKMDENPRERSKSMRQQFLKPPTIKKPTSKKSE